MTRLDVYLESVPAPIGTLKTDADGSLSFSYRTDTLPHPLSVSLPVREEPYGDVATRGFFANLLFENELRDQVMQRYGLEERDVAGLLYHLGADCPGAVSCVPEGAGPAKRPGDLATNYDPLDGSPIVPDTLDNAGPLPVAGELARIMASLRDRRRLPAETSDPSPLAGVQGKIAVARLPDGRLALPRPGTGAPTTHILKVPTAREMTHVPREHLATGIMAQAQNHPVQRTAIIGDGDLQGLLIERFDRRVEAGAVHRLHQEDFCQALGLGQFLKYERNGSPSLAFSAQAIGTLLSQTRLPGAARLAFFEVTLINMLLGNSDNHAKNHALLYSGPRPEFAPIYDVDPVLLDDVNHEMSFRIGSARMADEVRGPDLDAFLRAIGARGFGQPQRRRVAELIEMTLRAADALPRPTGKGLFDVIGQQAHHLSANLGMEITIPDFDNVPVNRP
ncbi:HipA domain-containing protein [Pontivivens insulae]|uniref:Serine/threonine-protein kinase HipA n=1 Tax=Pontivivens insulae TaxID=1639689 RepID=A0A2R8AFX6_9RHOB|nr:HipA domain-containing protein [Pontivivens insulae]RED10669.1 serine/threonine-protein kinase HipA [Pontivivens insulae]SPF31119.1 Serine/threonine-protein kinase HipA [Pontivivens insulae]